MIVPMGYFGVKAYIQSPAEGVGSIPNVEALLRKVKATGLPLFIDVNLAEPSRLFALSPFRFEKIHLRRDQAVPSNSTFAGAFSEDIIDSDNEEEGSDFLIYGKK
jgi:hypothetical protein